MGLVDEVRLLPWRMDTVMIPAETLVGRYEQRRKRTTWLAGCERGTSVAARMRAKMAHDLDEAGVLYTAEKGNDIMGDYVIDSREAGTPPPLPPCLSRPQLRMRARLCTSPAPRLRPTPPHDHQRARPPLPPCL